MAKPSIAFRKANKATKEFMQLLGKLSKSTRRLVRVAAIEFDKDPTRKTFRFHQLKETSRGNHQPDSYSVSVNMSIRAIYVLDGDVKVWYWIGTHAEYNRFTGG